MTTAAAAEATTARGELETKTKNIFSTFSKYEREKKVACGFTEKLIAGNYYGNYYGNYLKKTFISPRYGN